MKGNVMYIEAHRPSRSRSPKSILRTSVFPSRYQCVRPRILSSSQMGARRYRGVESVLRVTANDHVDSTRGRSALMRGPIVYYFEGADNGQAVQNLVIPPGTKFTAEFRTDFLGGVTVLNGNATAVFKTASDQVVSVQFKVTAIPYYANANRGACQMQVWMADNQEHAKPQQQE